MERRTTERKVELRNSDDGNPIISGYAAVFYRDGDEGTEYRLWENTYERIVPGAFDVAVREDDIRALFNHDPDYVLGRNVAGTLTLSIDSVGLRYDIDAPDTQLARDLRTSIERGDITGSSFAFSVEDERWFRDGEREIRELRGLRLADVGPVTYPAYEATSTDVRSAKNSHASWMNDRRREQAERQQEMITRRLRLLTIDDGTYNV